MSDERTIKPNAPADFTPQLGDYKTLQPFRYWCQKVLPLVYDDSLSYYELLCKVVDYLNKTMEDVETLHGDVTSLHAAYTELQDYVNNYFSTLDVQEEINNKLDKMAESGVLGNILSKIIPIGQPIFINTTNEMTNKNAIYVLTTNGMIYTYKNTQFEATGLTYGSPNNVLINQITTTYTKFRDIDTMGYVRITAEIYNAMTDKEGLPTGRFSGVLLNLNHAFQDKSIRYQELLLYSSDTGYLTYRRFFGTASPTDVAWTEYGVTGNQKNINYIALGDSRTKGKEKNYPEIIHDNLGYTVTNLGVSGSTIMPKEGHDSMVNIVKSYNFNSADVVSIMYGRNDYKLLNPLGTYLDTTNTTVMGCLYTSIVKILNDNNKCNIVVFSPFNDFSYGSAPNYAKDFENSAGYTLENLCNELKKFCNYYQLKYVDLINTFPSTINLENIPDGVHLIDDSGLASVVASEIY